MGAKGSDQRFLHIIVAVMNSCWFTSYVSFFRENVSSETSSTLSHNYSLASFISILVVLFFFVAFLCVRRWEYSFLAIPYVNVMFTFIQFLKSKSMSIKGILPLSLCFIVFDIVAIIMFVEQRDRLQHFVFVFIMSVIAGVMRLFGLLQFVLSEDHTFNLEIE